MFSGGTGAHGMTPEGEAAVGGCVAGLPEAQAFFCGSIVSGLRMQTRQLVRRLRVLGHREPGGRSAIPRGGPGNPHGANVEVKVVDPSANPYFATAAILGLALDGIERSEPTAAGDARRPGTLSEQDRKARRHRALSADQP